MKLALLKELEVQIGERKFGILLDYDLEVYKERLCNIAYEYYLGNKYKIKEKIFKVDNKVGFLKTEVKVRIDDSEMKELLKESFSYAFNVLEKEMKKQSIHVT